MDVGEASETEGSTDARAEVAECVRVGDRGVVVVDEARARVRVSAKVMVNAGPCAATELFCLARCRSLPPAAFQPPVTVGLGLGSGLGLGKKFLTCPMVRGRVMLCARVRPPWAEGLVRGRYDQTDCRLSRVIELGPWLGN